MPTIKYIPLRHNNAGENRTEHNTTTRNKEEQNTVLFDNKWAREVEKERERERERR